MGASVQKQTWGTDLSEIHVGWVICLLACLLAIAHSKLQLICIVWVNTAMNYRPWRTAQERFPSLSLSPTLPQFSLPASTSFEFHPSYYIHLYLLCKWSLWVILAFSFFHILALLCKEWGANSKTSINCRLTHLLHHSNSTEIHNVTHTSIYRELTEMYCLTRTCHTDTHWV